MCAAWDVATGVANHGASHPGDVCAYCVDGGYVVADRDTGFYTCVTCGMVDGDDQVVSFVGSLPTHIRNSIYRRQHHWNERMSQWSGTEPAIPDDLFALVVREASKEKYPKTYGQETIRAILRAVNVPARLAEKYRSKKFKKNAFTSMVKLGEKWRTIQSRLRKAPLVAPARELVRKMSDGFARLQTGFETIRHTKNCKGGYKCHWVHKCRHNFINYNYVIVKLLETHGTKAEIAKWKGCFRQISRPKLRKLDTLWDQIHGEIARQRALLAHRKPPSIVKLKIPQRRTPTTHRLNIRTKLQRMTDALF